MARQSALLPREHGAYAELGFPLITGLALGRPTVATLGFAIAALASFLAHEPVAVLLGVRGERVRAELASKARRRVAWLFALGVASGLAAMLLATRSTRLAALVPLALGAALIPAYASGRLKTLGSEILIIAALSAAVLPLALSAGVDWETAVASAAVWFVTFTLGTIAVHAIKARHKNSFGSRWTIAATPVLGSVVIGLGAWTALSTELPMGAALALLPAGLTTMLVGLVRVHPKRLKRVGWSLVVANSVALLLLVSL